MSVSQTRHSNVLVLLLSCAPGPPTPLYILVRARLKGVVHSVVRDLRFLGNFSHGIAFMSQNKNRLSFRRKLLVSGCFEPVIEPTNLMLQILTSLKKASFIASLIRTTVFSCANIIAKGFSKEQLAF